MSQWIKIDHDFGVPAVVFQLPMRQLAIEHATGGSEVVRALTDGNPERIEAAFLKLVEKYRPEFPGGAVVTMSVNLGAYCCEFLYVHPLLPRNANGTLFPEIPLVRLDQGRTCSKCVYWDRDDRCLGCGQSRPETTTATTTPLYPEADDGA